MSLGIALHAALAFSPIPGWTVEDTRQSRAFALFLAAVHGFRMPLYFLLSGFFSAMLWRGRGLRSLLAHRARRVLLPLLLGLVTVVPAVSLVSRAAIDSAARQHARQGARPASAPPVASDLGAAASRQPPAPRAEWRRAAVRAMQTPFFEHLWFLWFLWWLVAGFAAVAWAAERLPGRRLWQGRFSEAVAHWAVLSPLRYVWLVPLTMLSQATMGQGGKVPAFGVDTSEGLLPIPHVFGYYALFFGFGALYFLCGDAYGRVGRGWRVTLPLALGVVLPLGIVFALGLLGLPGRIAPAGLHRPLALAFQALYAWLMTFALLGLARRLLARENPTIRYLSDASYWLYLMHLPLILLLQLLVRDWPLPALVKCALICAAVSALLLVMYQTMVRYTWLGRLLNGPRERPQPGIS